MEVQQHAQAPSNAGGGDANDAGEPGQQPPAGELMSSFFPSPPSYYKQFTSANIAFAKRLVSHEAYDSAREDWAAQQTTILEALEVPEVTIQSLKEVDLRGLVEAPDVQLIEEDGHWMSFGQAWPINESLPSLQDMGVSQMYETPTTFEGRRKALHVLLYTLLHTYLRLLTVLTGGPPSLIHEQAQQQSAEPQYRGTQADSLIEHIRTTSINIHHLCNEWRPVQAREMIKLLMRNQIQERKQRTEELRLATLEIQAKLDGLKTRLRADNTADLRSLGAEMAGMDVAIEAEMAGSNDMAEEVKDVAKRETRARMLAALDAV